jgi:hypothetical protein
LIENAHIEVYLYLVQFLRTTVMILIQVIPFTGLLTVDPKDRLKMSDLRNSKWVQNCVMELRPSVLRMTLDILPHSTEAGVSALHHAHQEEFGL